MIARNPIRAAPATPLILSVGRLSRQKDYPTLLRAAAMLVHRPWRLRICGIGPDRKALLALAERLGIADRVEFSGFVADMAPHYSEATVMALSSRWEDLPATLSSEEHTSEIQSLMRISYAVLCLKKKTQPQISMKNYQPHTTHT